MARSAVLAAIAAAVAAVPAAPATAAAAAARSGEAGQEPAGSYRDRADVQAFAAAVADRRGLDLRWVLEQLAPARRVPAVARLIMPPPPGQAKNWAAYRARFIEPQRIGAGVDFVRRHEATLRRAEADYGVPADIVAAVIGVETLYGRHTGNFRVLDALATLAFDFPSGRSDRSGYFRAELEELLVLARREGIAAASLKGSYAGAIGLPQFMPGSINRDAIDYDGDGRVDLAGSAADAIGSVARYLAVHGWQRDLPTHYDVRAPAQIEDRARLLAPDIVPTYSAAQFAAHGAALSAAAAAHDGPLALVQLHNGDTAPPSYVAGTQNFYALTRYNWSAYYAMAVIELAHALQPALRTNTARAQSPP